MRHSIGNKSITFFIDGFNNRALNSTLNLNDQENKFKKKKPSHINIDNTLRFQPRRYSDTIHTPFKL